MSTEETHSGIPTRAIHEAYLDMQRAMKQYRQAKDMMQQDALDTAHRELQTTTTTLYEQLRPYLEQGATSADYWNGEPPPYPDTWREPHPSEGIAILQVQRQTDPFEIDVNKSNGSGFQSPQNLHQEIPLDTQARITGYEANGSVVLVAYQVYMKGLKQLDRWETESYTTVERAEGFMSNSRKRTVEQRRIEIPKLKRAARCLSNVCHDLGLLAHINETRDTYHAGGDTNDHPEPFGAAEKPD